MNRMFRKPIFYVMERLLFHWQKEKYERYHEKYRLPQSFRFNGENILIYGEGAIEAGEDSYIGSYSTLQLTNGYKISIGRQCRISHNVRMYTRSAESDSDFSDSEINTKAGDIIIEDFVWIGANVFINPGIRIGQNSIVAANSVLSKDVAPYSIVGGVPAKLIRYKNFNKNEGADEEYAL